MDSASIHALTGRPLEEVKKSVAALPEHAAVIYTAMTNDGAGMRLLSYEACRIVASATTRPIVVDIENRIGHGGTGGPIVQNATIGEEVAAIVLRILNGESASQIPPAATDAVLLRDPAAPSGTGELLVDAVMGLGRQGRALPGLEIQAVLPHGAARRRQPAGLEPEAGEQRVRLHHAAAGPGPAARRRRLSRPHPPRTPPRGVVSPRESRWVASSRRCRASSCSSPRRPSCSPASVW